MKKLLSCILLIALIFSVFSLPALAEEAGGTGEWVFDLPESEAETLLAETEPTAPFVPESMDKTIFGSDDRITVNNPAQYPYSAICYIKIKKKCGCTSTGTGFMASQDNTVFTAAHCVVCADHGEWAEELTFYFGYKNDRNYLYKYNGKWYAYAGNLYSGKQYTTDYDYAVIKLYDDVCQKTGSFGVHWNPSDSLINSTYVYSAGYRDGQLRYDQGFISPNGANHVKYTLDTQPGNSGGPIFTSDYYAIGINIAQNNSYNTGYRITSDVKYAYDYVK